MERLVWIDGALVPEHAASVSVRDLGLVYGDAVFDTARTFGGRIFRLAEHIERLWDSLAYVRIDPGMTRAEMSAATEALVAANAPALRPGEDWWVTQRVTAGRQHLDGEPNPAPGATVIIDVVPLPLRARAPYFRDGIPAVIAARRKIAPDALSPRAKTTNYLNMQLAQREVSAQAPGAWALMLDAAGDIAEGAGCNFFVVKDGAVLTPPADFVLPGVSRQVVIELCAGLGIPCREARVPRHLALTADEAFFTSTSLCACPVASLDGRRYPAGVPGPVTRRIMEAFAAHVGFDYVAQYLRFLGTEGPVTGV